MDVTLPDGTVIKDVPEGTSKAELASKLQRSGYQIPPEWMGAPAQRHEPSIGQKADGVVEAAKASITAPFAYLHGLASGGNLLVQRLLYEATGTPGGDQLETPEAAFARGSAAEQYVPKTELGQEYTQKVADAMGFFAPLAGMAGETQALSQAMKTARMGAPAATTARATAEGVARDVAGAAGASAVSGAIDSTAQAARTIQRGATTLPKRAWESITKAEPTAPTPGTMGSVGAAATDAAAQRVATAESLGLTGNAGLTKGQATRNPEQLKFEVDTAGKNMELGAPIRERRIAQNDALLRNFDNAIDQTGAEAPNLRAVGQSVDGALVKQYTADKAAVKNAYERAHASNESNAIVDQTAPVTLPGDRPITTTPLEWLNSQPKGTAKSALLDAVRHDAVKLGIADEVGGNLVPKTMEARQFPAWMTDQTATTRQPVGSTVRQMENWRQEINARTGFDPAEIRQATILKALIDGQTEPLAGPLYRQARALRTRLAQNYEDRASVAKLLNTKRGMADRQVALEDVFKHSILDGSLDDMTNIRRVLMRSGDEGKQAWTELKAQTIKHIRDEATKSVALDSAGNRVISPAALDRVIRGLDHDEKLTAIFGKNGAQRLRDINDIAQVAKTVPPEAAVNFTNTATTLLTASGDVAASIATGVPAPLLTAAKLGVKHIKDAKTKKRIAEALAGIPRSNQQNSASLNYKPGAQQ